MRMTHPDLGDITALVDRLREDVFYGDARLLNMDRHNPLHMRAADAIEAQQAALAAKDSEIERLREALGKDVTRFTYCAQMIETSFLAGGTLRAERAMKAQHFALEAQAALGDVKP